MAIRPIDDIKSKFETGDRPTGQDFADLIDTTAHYAMVLGADGNNSQTINGIENATTIDTIDTTVWRTVKYLIQYSHNPSGSHWGSELNIVFDGNDINVSEYGTVSNYDGTMANLTTTINSGIISMIVTPVLSPITVRFYRTGLKG